MDWKYFENNLGGLKIEGRGHHAPSELIRVNDLPTNVYIVMNEWLEYPKVSAMRFVWSLDENYKNGIFTGISHHTFSSVTQNLNGYQSYFLRVQGRGAQIDSIDAVALGSAALDFLKIRPAYKESLEKCVKSIVMQAAKQEELKERMALIRC